MSLGKFYFYKLLCSGIWIILLNEFDKENSLSLNNILIDECKFRY